MWATPRCRLPSGSGSWANQGPRSDVATKPSMIGARERSGAWNPGAGPPMSHSCHPSAGPKPLYTEENTTGATDTCLTAPETSYRVATHAPTDTGNRADRRGLSLYSAPTHSPGTTPTASPRSVIAGPWTTTDADSPCRLNTPSASDMSSSTPGSAERG